MIYPIETDILSADYHTFTREDFLAVLDKINECRACHLRIGQFILYSVT